MPGKRTPYFAPGKVWSGWAIADNKGRMVRDRVWGVPFCYSTKQEAMCDAESGQGAVRVILQIKKGARDAG